MADGERTRLRMLVTVKAYPSISKRKGETVCVAGLRVIPDGGVRWARLWPVPFRDMDLAGRFSTWQWIELDTQRTAKDRRPESWQPLVDSILVEEKVDTRGGWRERMRILEPAILSSMCELRRRQAVDGTSLGAFRPNKITAVTTDQNEPWSSEQHAVAAQPSLLMPDKRPLEWIPTRFRYEYRCGDAEPACNGHAQTVVDWGLLQLYRNSARMHGPEKAKADVVTKMEEIAGPAKDTILLVGNQHQAPLGWMIIGMVYPPITATSERDSDQLRLDVL